MASETRGLLTWHDNCCKQSRASKTNESEQQPQTTFSSGAGSATSCQRRQTLRWELCIRSSLVKLLFTEKIFVSEETCLRILWVLSFSFCTRLDRSRRSRMDEIGIVVHWVIKKLVLEPEGAFLPLLCLLATYVAAKAGVEQPHRISTYKWSEVRSTSFHAWLQHAAFSPTSAEADGTAFHNVCKQLTRYKFSHVWLQHAASSPSAGAAGGTTFQFHNICSAQVVMCGCSMLPPPHRDQKLPLPLPPGTWSITFFEYS